MRASKALQLHVDNLRRQVHQLQVENERLKSKVSNRQGDEIEQLRIQEESSELRQSLHNAQEREVSSNELLHKSHTEYDELKSHYDNVVLERETLSMELINYQAWYEQTCTELKRVKETAETEKYPALDEERVKWERREATWYAQLERARTTVSGPSIGCTHCHWTLLLRASFLPW